MVPIVSFYAGLLALLFVCLCVRVIRIRRSARVAVGDGRNPELQRAQRVQANFAEYVPLALVLCALIEIDEGSGWLLHGLMLPFFLGRLIHAYGVSQLNENFRWRILGMNLTFFPIVVAALVLIF